MGTDGINLLDLGGAQRPLIKGDFIQLAVEQSAGWLVDEAQFHRITVHANVAGARR